MKMGWLLVASALVASGCKSDFTEGRVLDSCDGNWPICSQIAGCLLGAQSYIQGRLPGTGKFIVQLAEPSTVRVHMFLQDVRGAGQETSISFFESGCVNRVRQAVTGQVFVGENNQLGEFIRDADLVGVGDHLISFTSDTDCRYQLKVDVEATRQ
jgi:hypothetical protein